MSTNPYDPSQVTSPSAEVEAIDAHGYRTSPTETTGMPGGVPYIVLNEAAERFSYYGMRAILVVFMTQYILGADGKLSLATDPEAREYYHLFLTGVYLFPILGALISDGLLGKYRTILYLSIVYCLGHLALALDESWRGLAVGLSLIAIGSGGIKPCVSAHVGDQFGMRNKHLLEKVFGWFYFAINAGALISTLLTPWLLIHYGPSLAFGVPGVLMLLATIVFWMGRHRFVHVPPGGLGFVREAFSPQGLRVVLRLCGLYLFIMMFWSLYEQTGSAWVQQAAKMDRTILGWNVHEAQVQAINPLLILLFIPLFTYVIYPTMGLFFRLTPLRKIGIGLFLAAVSFLVSAQIEVWIQQGETPSIVWQLLAYVIITAAEVMVSIVGLEFSYTQAPNKMKSVVMALYFFGVSMGNLFASQVNRFITNEDGSSMLNGVEYYLFFAGLMAATAVLYVLYARSYKEQTFVQ
ncbi:MAG: POT family MFS transporter, partial [Planctomycetota bacterium]|nr:POT family MFS transporter [Planctomycetota bacterium]